MTKTVTCIIPFYNEGRSILSVVQAVNKVKNINQIICVDDGSINNTADLIQGKFSSVTLIKFDKNQGKSMAVKAGLEKAHNELIFLTDGDLIGLKSEEVERGIEKFQNSGIDLIIFQVVTTKAKLDGWLNKYITFSGTRILKRDDLRKVLDNRPNGYQLETEMNDYFMKNGKTVRWIKCSAINPNKLDKRGFIKGFIKNIKMELSIISYLGFVNHLKQIFTFGREELK